MKNISHVIGYSAVTVIAFVVGAVIIFAADTGQASSAASSATTSTRTVTSTATVTDPGSTTTTTAPPETTTETKTTTVTAEPPPPETAIPGDGTFEVGVDIEPGTYVSEEPSGRSCYWARLSKGSGGLNDIIANNNSSGQSIVTIAASDAFFETSRCGGWTKR